MYTDGVTETCNPAEELFGSDRLVKSMQELKGHTAQGIIANLRTRLESFSQKSAATDDVVLISIKIQNK